MIHDKIKDAFQPIIDLTQAISYPLCFLVVSCGFILIMVGDKGRGKALLKWGAIGYVGLQFVPVIMDILYEVGKAMIN